MPLPPDLHAGDAIGVQIRGLLHGQRVINTFWYRVEAVGTPVDIYSAAQELAAEFTDHVYSQWRLNVSSDVIDCFIVAQTYHEDIVLGQFTSEVWRENPGSPTGGVMESAEPSTVTAVIARRTGFGGRSNRGRIFMPGVPQTYVLGSDLTGAAQVAYQAGVGSVIPDQLDPPSFTAIPCMFDPTPPWSIGKDILTTSISPELRVQRRREVGRGE